MPDQYRPAKCHPERRHAAKGMCFPCYREQYPTAKRATCHDDRLAKVNGLCGACYERFLKDRDPEYAERQRASFEAWASRNGDRIREYKSTYGGKTRVRKRRSIQGRERSLAQFGLTWEDEERIVAGQGGVCAICGATPERAFDIDHDHDTNRVRGFLCGRCNKGLGLLGDSLAGVEAALAYLRSPPADLYPRIDPV